MTKNTKESKAVAKTGRKASVPASVEKKSSSGPAKNGKEMKGTKATGSDVKQKKDRKIPLPNKPEEDKAETSSKKAKALENKTRTEKPEKVSRRKPAEKDVHVLKKTEKKMKDDAYGYDDKSDIGDSSSEAVYEQSDDFDEMEADIDKDFNNDVEGLDGPKDDDELLSAIDAIEDAFNIHGGTRGTDKEAGTVFDESAYFESKIKSKLHDIKLMCEARNIPFYATACIANTKDGSSYHSEAFVPEASGIKLKDDRFVKHVNVDLGFDTVLHRESMS